MVIDIGEVLTIIHINDGFHLRMVLYKDYVRINFRIHSLVKFKQYVSQPELPKHLDAGYLILLDKKGITTELKAPAYKAFNIRKPTPEEFLATVTDFWWDSIYVAKSLWRDELFYAKYM